MPGPSTDTTGRIRTTSNGGASAPEQQQQRTLLGTLRGEKMQAAIRRALPDQGKLDRAIANIMTALNQTPGLADCTPETFFGCVMQAAQLGLEVNSPKGEAYLIPRRNNKRNVTEATLIVGYQGMIALAYRGDVVKIWTRTVRAGDHFKVKYGLTEDIEHVPSQDPDRERRPIDFVYAVAQLKNGEKIFEVLSSAQIENRRARSASGQSGPWSTDPEAMARKSGIRAVFRWLPKSSEMARVEAMEERADSGRPQIYDEVVNQGLQHAGLNPILDTEGEDTTPLDLPQVQFDADGVVVPREGQA